MTTPYQNYENQNMPPIPEPAENIKKLAYVIDGVVVQTLSTNERLAAIIMSEPTIVDISDIFVQGTLETEDGTTQIVIANDWTYDGTTFHAPA